MRGNRVDYRFFNDMTCVLVSLEPIFQDAKDFAGLNLKPSRCVIAPLCETSNSRARNVFSWLESNLPPRKDFLIKDASKYLGFVLGPKAGTLQWKAPLEKYKDRVEEIYNSRASIAIASYTYNVRAFSVVSYVRQLAPPPKQAKAIEKSPLFKITHMANNSIRTGDFIKLHHFGGPSLRSMGASSKAALFR